MVIEANPKKFMYNQQYVRFLSYYDMIPKVCKIKHSWTKGKVERPFYYIQEHFLRGLEVKSFEEFDTFLSEFTETYNRREHSSLKESPEERFKREKDLLIPPLEIEPGGLFELNLRKVSNDGYISWKGNFYPVPMKFCRKVPPFMNPNKPNTTNSIPARDSITDKTL